jgi:hypothetical protein
MAIFLYLATAMGLFIATQTNGNWVIVKHALKQKGLTAIAVSGDVIVAGTTDGIWRSSDTGNTWHVSGNDLEISHVRWLANSLNPPVVFLAGTEPAGIFVSHDNGRTWGGKPEVGELRDANGWFLPYSPKAGCVRGFAIAEPDDHRRRIYAAVEVGGVLISEDSGASWRLAEGSDGNPAMDRQLGTMIHPDVHSITVHPTSSDLVTAATGGGLYRSTDGGRTWKNLYRCYMRAIWVDPADHRHMVAGPADGVSRNGRIEQSYDGGLTWQIDADGMTAMPWSKHMVERFVQFDKDLFAVLSNGELWSRPLNQSMWHRVLPETPAIKALAVKRG